MQVLQTLQILGGVHDLNQRLEVTLAKIKEKIRLRISQLSRHIKFRPTERIYVRMFMTSWGHKSMSLEDMNSPLAGCIHIFVPSGVVYD